MQAVLRLVQQRPRLAAAATALVAATVLGALCRAAPAGEPAAAAAAAAAANHRHSARALTTAADVASSSSSFSSSASLSSSAQRLAPRRTASTAPSPPRPMEPKPVVKSDEEWKKELSQQEFEVLRKKGTERAGSGEYNKHYPKSGYYACRGCGQPLYTAAAKFDSGCGWPAFDKLINGAVSTHEDTSFGMTRIEIICSACGGHLGHVFHGEHLTKTNERHCVNSVSIKYVDKELPEEAKAAGETTVKK